MSAPAFDPGAVHVCLRWGDGRVRGVDLRVSRPAAAAVLRGRRADDAVRVLPALYAVCGAAQGVAARLALAAARGVALQPAVDATVLAEGQREHLWRLLLDWPQALGLERQETLFVTARKKISEGSFPEWAKAALRAHCDGIIETLGALPQPVLPEDSQLPAMTADETVTFWPRLDPAFAAAPSHRGFPAGTGALARHRELSSHGPVVSRVMARVADLVEPDGLGRTSASMVAAGIGRAAVETARGLLLHEIVLDGDRVADYTIVAPTEWNFHPAGALKSLLAGLTAPGAAELRAAAARAALAFDPCVRCEIEIEAV